MWHSASRGYNTTDVQQQLILRVCVGGGESGPSEILTGWSFESVISFCPNAIFSNLYSCFIPDQINAMITYTCIYYDYFLMMIIQYHVYSQVAQHDNSFLSLIGCYAV